MQEEIVTKYIGEVLGIICSKAVNASVKEGEVKAPSLHTSMQTPSPHHGRTTDHGRSPSQTPPVPHTQVPTASKPNTHLHGEVSHIPIAPSTPPHTAPSHSGSIWARTPESSISISPTTLVK